MSGILSSKGLRNLSNDLEAASWSEASFGSGVCNQPVPEGSLAVVHSDSRFQENLIGICLLSGFARCIDITVRGVLNVEAIIRCVPGYCHFPEATPVNIDVAANEGLSEAASILTGVASGKW